MSKVLSQDETPVLYSIVFGEGVVNDATSIVLFYSLQSLDISNIDAGTALKLLWTFLYLLFTSTALGVAVSSDKLSTIIFLVSVARSNAEHDLYRLIFVMFLSFIQAGLISAFIIKTLYFGR